MTALFLRSPSQLSPSHKGHALVLTDLSSFRTGCMGGDVMVLGGLGGPNEPPLNAACVCYKKNYALVYYTRFILHPTVSHPLHSLSQIISDVDTLNLNCDSVPILIILCWRNHVGVTDIPQGVLRSR